VLEPGTSLSMYYPKWAVASAYLLQDLLCVCLKRYGPNVILLHSSVPVLVYYLPVCGFSEWFPSGSCCITYRLPGACTHERPSVPHIELHESARCTYKTRQVWVNKSMDAATAGDNWSRCRHCLRLQLPLPLSLIPFCSSHSQWICNGHAGFSIRDAGRQVFRTAERSGSASIGGGEAEYNATPWVCLWGSSGCWCAMTLCTRHAVWCNHWLSLSSGWGGSHALSDNCHARIVQLRWGGGVLTRDCRGYGTLSLRGIPLASRCGNVPFSRGSWEFPEGLQLCCL